MNSNRDVAAFQAGWRQMAPVGRCWVHTHTCWEIIYHARGAGRGFIADQPPFAVRAGTVDVIPPRVPHDQEMTQAGEDWCITVRATRGLAARLAGPLHGLPLEDACLLREIEALCDLHPRMDDLRRAECDHRVTAILLGLIGVASRRTPATVRPADAYARRAHEFILENCCALARMEDVAAAVGISYNYLRHAFRRCYGLSLMAWLVEARTQRARSLLTHSGMPLKEVATSCGFESEQYFSTSFSRRVGLPPGEFRRRGQGRPADRAAGD